MSAIISFHYDGENFQNHTISLRTLARTLQHLQSAVDRAHLDIKYGRVWKHAKPTKEDREATNFIVGMPREGGYILDVISQSASEITKRVSGAVGIVIQRSQIEVTDEKERLPQQAEDRRRDAARSAMNFADYIGGEDDSLTTTYGVRSVAKEIDQILSTIRGPNNTNTLDFDFRGDDFNTTYGFNNETARAFHKTVSRRDLGEPMWIMGYIRELDGGDRFSSPKGKFNNETTGRMHTLHIEDDVGYNSLVLYMKKKKGASQKIRILACPVHEFGSFEPFGGDLYYLGTAEVVDTIDSEEE